MKPNPLPKIMIRPDDKEEFILIETGLYMNKKLLEDFPDSFHFSHSYERLAKLGFYAKN